MNLKNFQFKALLQTLCPLYSSPSNNFDKKANLCSTYNGYSDPICDNAEVTFLDRI